MVVGCGCAQWASVAATCTGLPGCKYLGLAESSLPTAASVVVSGAGAVVVPGTPVVLPGAAVERERGEKGGLCERRRGLAVSMTMYSVTMHDL